MSATGKRVLVMDDEDVVCKSYERVLTQTGFQVDKVNSGPAALMEAGRHDYDVVLADLKMPGMGGLQVIEKLRTTHPWMPVVVVTGFPSQDTLHEATRLGVTDYLTKPVTPAVLREATMQALTTPTYGWSLTPRQPVAPQAKTDPIPTKLPPGPVLWPEHPVDLPAWPAVTEEVTEEVAKEVGKDVSKEVSKVAAPTTEREPGALDTALRLMLAPVISLAYVLFLPFLGIALFVGLGSKALWEKVWRVA